MVAAYTAPIVRNRSDASQSHSQSLKLRSSCAQTHNISPLTARRHGQNHCRDGSVPYSIESGAGPAAGAGEYILVDAAVVSSAAKVPGSDVDKFAIRVIVRKKVSLDKFSLFVHRKYQIDCSIVTFHIDLTAATAVLISQRSR